MNCILNLLKEGITHLEGRSETPSLDAEILLAFVLQTSRTHLKTWPEKTVSEPISSRYQTLIEARQKGEPIAYLVGTQEFYSLSFLVTHDTLVPRPETEGVIDILLELLAPNPPQTILDLGTGTGAIAIAIAKERPHWNLTAIDASPQAIAIAKQNGANHHCTRLTFVQSNWFEHLSGQTFHAIVSNPPYLSSSDPQLTIPPLCYEPQEALLAGPTGYEHLFDIATHSKNHLEPGGWLCLEHGSSQSNTLCEYLENLGYISISTQKDLAGLDRITCAKWPLP